MPKRAVSSQIVPIALALVLALLSHDLAMAGDPHAVTPRSVPMQLHGHHTEVHSPASTGDRSAPTFDRAHLADCGVVLPAVAPSRSFMSSLASSPLTSPSLDTQAQSLPTHVGHPPTRPPNVRRALIQVFLI